MRLKRVLSALVIGSLLTDSQFTAAAVSVQEAARLKSELTPLGAERAQNPEGTIPAWTGGYTTVWPGYQSGQPRPDPFASEQPLFRITAKNMDQYTDKLSDGMKALLQRFPTFRIDVYPTHRTAAAPQWVYDNTFINATRARTINNELSIEGAYGGIPFPIPKSGAEAMWNHLLIWKGEGSATEYATYIVNGGQPVQAIAGKLSYQYPYYYRNGSLENFTGNYLIVRLDVTAPPLRAGEGVVVHDPVDQYTVGRKAWQYLVGQRRVRRLPNLAYDVPDFFASGLSLDDEFFLFNGALDRYAWKLVGKKEMFVPYNTHSFHTRRITEVLGLNHTNPDYLRWELHRVWVVEATLAPGKRHVLPKRYFYLDEDSWQAMLADGWDANGQLWHAGYVLPIIVPEIPAVVSFPFFIYDLRKRAYEAGNLYNDMPYHYQVVPRRPEDYFSPDALAGKGIR